MEVDVDLEPRPTLAWYVEASLSRASFSWPAGVAGEKTAQSTPYAKSSMCVPSDCVTRLRKSASMCPGSVSGRMRSKVLRRSGTTM